MLEWEEEKQKKTAARKTERGKTFRNVGGAKPWLVMVNIKFVRLKSKAGAATKIRSNTRPGIWNFQMVLSLQVQAALAWWG